MVSISWDNTRLCILTQLTDSQGWVLLKTNLWNKSFGASSNTLSVSCILVGHCYLLSYILHTLCPWFPVRPGPPLVPGLPAAPWNYANKVKKCKWSAWIKTQHNTQTHTHNSLGFLLPLVQGIQGSPHHPVKEMHDNVLFKALLVHQVSL